MSRTILHVDLNNFFASVACLDNPALTRVPMAVCGDPNKRHGIILSKNQAAKAYGVKTAETIWQAKSKCPDLVTAAPNFEQYNKYSLLAREIYNRYTDLIEPFGIDEAWLDVTSTLHLFGSGKQIADAIRSDLKRELGLTASVGVSFNKIFAKLGSDLKKPDATTMITEDNFRSLVWPLPVGDLLFVGKATQKKLCSRAIFTIGDLANRDPHALTLLLGKYGAMLWTFANGQDQDPVLPQEEQAGIKSIGNSTTTPRDLTSEKDVKIIFFSLAETIAYRLRKRQLKGSILSISIRNHALVTIERQTKLSLPTNDSGTIARQAMQLFTAHWRWCMSIRSLGIQISALTSDHADMQMSLFQPMTKETNKLDAVLDNIRAKFGPDSIQRCLMLTDQELATFHAPKDAYAQQKQKRP